MELGFGLTYPKQQNASWNCHILYGGEMTYEVLSEGDRFVINMERRTCTCKVWNLSELPCKYVYKIMVHRKEKLEEHIDECYLRKKFIKSY